MRRTLLLILVAAVVAACTSSETSPTTSPAPPTTAPASTSTTVITTPPTTSAPEDTTTTTTTTSTTIPLSEVVLTTELVADGFGQPVFLTNAGDARLFVVDQPGLIWVIDDADPEVFLDITSDVAFEGERGLLGLAFHPEYASNGRFYVNYTGNDGDTRIEEFTVSSDPNIADPASRRIVLEIGQPAGNHNGGMIAFGPDGALWAGMGDGGGADDQYGQGQRGDTLLGAMVRITVGPEESPYGIPEGNAFEAAEVWAIGLRNPWRFSFDGADLWIGDVGQGAVEEIDRVSTADTGLNLGWSIMEGSTCFRADSCDQSGLVLPVAEYGHDAGCSVIGGYVYRGAAVPTLDGHYFYGDLCSGFLRSIAPDGAEYDWTGQVGSLGGLTSFGVDAAGELYATLRSGSLLKFTTP